MNREIILDDQKLWRILVVDDNPSIHDDFRKILCPEQIAQAASIASLAQDVFGDLADFPTRRHFEMDSAFQGQEALEKVRRADAEGRPYSLTFMDVRMPPGWDGVETIRHIWNEHPHIQVVICTAYSDYSWEEILKDLGETDSLVILKKPFDNVEVLQLAQALSKKWAMTRAAKARMADLDDMVRQRTSELLQANERLESEIQRRSEVEMQLRESEERFRTAFTSVPVPMIIADAVTSCLLEVNRSFLKLTGFTETELIGQSMSDVKIVTGSNEYLDIRTKLMQGQPIRDAALTLRRKDGINRYTVASVEPITLGRKLCHLAAFQDITQTRDLEEQLRQSQKMEAIGQLAAGIAHDFNNLLTIIHGYTGLQLTKRNLDSDVEKAFRQVKAASDRAASLTRQLLAFSRQQIMQRKPCDLLDTANRMKGLLPQAMGEMVTLECNIPAGLPRVFADESNLDQIIMNLAVNAHDAMPEGGILTLSARKASVTAADAAGHPDKREGDYVVLTVADSGCGMDKQTLAKIFEPFFTTKPIGRGTGLGLSTVFGIVKQHNGWIQVDSRLGKGSTFEIFLPVADEQTCPPKGLSGIEPCQEKRPNPGEIVLVVEDEPEVREFIVGVLSSEGYETVQAVSGADALAKWSTVSDRIQLLITDIIMPQGISGTMLAKHLLRRKPGLRVLYISGYRPDATNDEDLMTEAANFLPKPFTGDQLKAMISRVLSQPAPVLVTDATLKTNAVTP